ncbi:transcriptional regulator, HxlR family [Micrococcales bacterium KH10]|nr:transcriptional regulator, HxlR family [Micrococcales bacterium KH10]
MTHSVSDYESICDLVGDDGARAIRDVLNRIGDKWSLLVIGALKDRTLRFTELHQQVRGISQRMLTLTLRQLERDGLITRTVHAEIPPRVEYELTAMGLTLFGPTQALAGWAIANYPAIEAARLHYDGQKST